MSTLEGFIFSVAFTLAITLIGSLAVRFLAIVYRKLP
jgi:hypothetical protein